MASYTANQLSGAGVLIEELTGGVSYVFSIGNTTSTGSAYFTVETVRDNKGFYSGGVYQFTPDSTIAAGSSYLRATGDMTLEITV